MGAPSTTGNPDRAGARVSVLVGLVFALTLPWPGRALAAGGEARLERGLALLHQGELRAAVRALTTAVKEVERGPVRARAHLHLGLAHAYLGAAAPAREAFKKALVANPLVSADQEHVPPNVRSIFRKVRRGVTGLLIVRGGPPTARIAVSGLVLGAAPLRQDLPVGRYPLKILGLRGRILLERKLVVWAGRSTELRLIAPEPPPAPPRPGPEAAKPPPAPVVTAPPSPPPPPEPAPLVLPVRRFDLTKRRWFNTGRKAGVALLGSGAVLGAVGLGFGIAARSAESDFQTAKRFGRIEVAGGLKADANRRALLANIFAGVGAAAGVAGIVLLLLPSESAKPALTIAPTGLGAMIAVRY